MPVQRDRRGRGSRLGEGEASWLSPLSFPAASPRDAGAGARGEESALPGLENSLLLSQLGEGGAGGRAALKAMLRGRRPPRLPQKARAASCLCPAGFVQLPTSGRIYKVPSASSDEIWL